MKTLKLRKGVKYKDTLLSREYEIKHLDLLNILGIKGDFKKAEIFSDGNTLQIITDEIIIEKELKIYNNKAEL